MKFPRYNTIEILVPWRGTLKIGDQQSHINRLFSGWLHVLRSRNIVHTYIHNTEPASSPAIKYLQLMNFIRQMLMNLTTVDNIHVKLYIIHVLYQVLVYKKEYTVVLGNQIRWLRNGSNRFPIHTYITVGLRNGKWEMTI